MFKRAFGLGVALIVGAVLVAASGAATTKTQASSKIDVSTRAAVIHYLRSIHVSTKHVVIQRGLRNYAGANCPGKGWTCAGTRHTVVQIAKRGGMNRYACTTAKCAVVQIGSARRSPVKATPKPPPPPNTALCAKTTGTVQSCVINQPNATGTNQAVVWMVTPKDTGLTQSSYYSASITQGPSSIGTGGSATNSNIACVKQSVWLDGSTTKTSSGNTTVTNDNHELITVTQNSLTGTNAVQGATQGGTQANPTYSCDTSNTSQLQQDEVLTSVVNQKGGSITQKQDTLPSTTTCVPASDPSITFSGCANVVTDIEQNKGSGFFGVAGQGFTAGQTQNTANFEQSTKQVAIANTPSGTVTQQQNANVTHPPFSGVVGTINQDSKAQSTATVNQDEKQCQDAVNVWPATISSPTTAPTTLTGLCPVTGDAGVPPLVNLTQTQYGPLGVVGAPSKKGANHFHTKGYGLSQQTHAGPNMYDTFNVTQISHQYTDQATAPNQRIQGDCASSGNGDPNGGTCNAVQNAFWNDQPISDGYTAGSIANLLITCTNGGGTANCQATPPPVPTITASSEPSNPTDSRSNTFSWTDVATGGVTYQCSFDSGVTFHSCSSGGTGATMSGLLPGSQTFEVRAVDTTSSTNASNPASFTWLIVDGQISLSPATATDDAATNSATLTTCTIQQNLGDGNNFVPASGAECDWSVTAGPNTGQSGHCTTDNTGTCTFSYTDNYGTNKNGTGKDTIHATTGSGFAVDGVSMNRSTLASGTDVHGDGLDVSKTWVDANVSVSSPATSDVTGSDTVTCSVNLDKGDGNGFNPAPTGTPCTVTVTSGPNASATDAVQTCSTTGGSCTVSISGTTTGTDTIQGSTSFTYSSVTLSRSTLTTGNDSSGDGLDVTNTWVDANISLDPPTFYSVGTPMLPMTCTIHQDAGDGNNMVAAPNAPCDWSVTSGPNAGQHGSCTTDNTGTCTFSYSDTNPGTDTIHATTGATFSVGGLNLSRSTLTSGNDSSGDGLDSSITWG